MDDPELDATIDMLKMDASHYLTLVSLIPPKVFFLRPTIFLLSPVVMHAILFTFGVSNS